MINTRTFINSTIWIFLTVVSVYLQDERWLERARDAKGTVYYVEKTFQRTSRGTILQWEKAIYSDGSYIVARKELNCADRIFRVLELNSYNHRGELLDSLRPMKWAEIVPESVGEGILIRTCSDAAADSRRSTAQRGAGKAKPSKTAVVTTQDSSGLYLRKTKSLKSPSEIFVPEGETVKVIGFDLKYETINGRRGRWVYVKYKNKSGWAWENYLMFN